MKTSRLHPEQMLATSGYLPGDMLPLKIYFRVYSSGAGRCLPPVIVSKIHDVDIWRDRIAQGYSLFKKLDNSAVLLRQNEASHLFDVLLRAPYFILDGNHRSLAATLAGHDVEAIVLERDSDIVQIKAAVATGALFAFPHSVETLEQLHGRFIAHALNLTDVPPRHLLVSSENCMLRQLRTVRRRAEQLFRNKDLPRYFFHRYVPALSVEEDPVLGGKEFSLNAPKDSEGAFQRPEAYQ